MTKKNSYAQNTRKWTPARHKQYQETLARKRAEKKQADEAKNAMAALEKQRASKPRFFVETDANVGMASEQVPSYSSMTEQVNRLIASNETLRAKLLIYEDLIFKAMKD